MRAMSEGSAAVAAAAKPAPAPRPSTPEPVAQARSLAEGGAVPAPATFADLVAQLAARREALLAAHLAGDVHLVHYEPGRLEFRARPEAPADLATRLSRLLAGWTGRPWMVSLSHEPGAATLREQALEREIERRRDAAALPLVQAILATFPGATVEAVRDLAASDREAADRAADIETELAIGDEIEPGVEEDR